MNILPVYSRYDITPVKGNGCYITLADGTQVLDLYGGHGVISIGHNHPNFKDALKGQIDDLVFYSNSVNHPLQDQLANALGKLSGYESYNLFLCNSGAEANENALKLASFSTKKSKVIAFKNGFHGRTSGAVAVTDNSRIQAEINKGHLVEFLELNDVNAFDIAIEHNDVCAVIIEGIQGVGGLDEANPAFIKHIQKRCNELGVILILDEIQSGYGRTGKFFAHQHHGICPDIITIAKGMGNGFPLAGVLINPKLEVEKGMLGTTFGGNQLACSAALSVLEVIDRTSLMENVLEMERYLRFELEDLPQIKQIKGRGLMLGLEFDFTVSELRKDLLLNHHIFTGGSSNTKLLRILPPLNVSPQELKKLVVALKTCLNSDS